MFLALWKALSHRLAANCSSVLCASRRACFFSFFRFFRARREDKELDDEDDRERARFGLSGSSKRVPWRRPDPSGSGKRVPRKTSINPT